MSTGDRRHPALLGLTVLVILLAITGVVVQSTISDSLGHWLVGGAVLGAIVMAVIGRRKRTT
jgi:hypothetical protein